MTILGIALGLLCGSGLLLVAWSVSRRHLSLLARVAPYVRPSPEGSRLWAETSSRTPIERLLAPLVRDASRLFERIGSTSRSVERRLRSSGVTTSVEQFRLEQVLWAAMGAVIGLALAFLSLSRGGPAVLAVALVVLGTAAGVVGRDYMLSHAATSHTRQVSAELPDAVELIALAVGAGQTPLAALERVSTVSSGVLARELRDMVARVHTGTPLVTALNEWGSSSGSPDVARLADALAVAIERGTPLARVLRDQARDVRESARQRLMELAGSKEILMMTPVVFLVLPITVMFALFPGLAALEIGL